MEASELWTQDPEELLQDLGFCGEEANAAARIPARFLSQRSLTRGISLQVLLEAQRSRRHMETQEITDRFKHFVLQQMTNSLTSSSDSRGAGPGQEREGLWQEGEEKRAWLSRLLQRGSRRPLRSQSFPEPKPRRGPQSSAPGGPQGTNKLTSVERADSCQSDSSGFLEEPLIPPLSQQAQPACDLTKGTDPQQLSALISDKQVKEAPDSGRQEPERPEEEMLQTPTAEDTEVSIMGVMETEARLQGEDSTVGVFLMDKVSAQSSGEASGGTALTAVPQDKPEPVQPPSLPTVPSAGLADSEMLNREGEKPKKKPGRSVSVQMASTLLPPSRLVVRRSNPGDAPTTTEETLPFCSSSHDDSTTQDTPPSSGLSSGSDVGHGPSSDSSSLNGKSNRSRGGHDRRHGDCCHGHHHCGRVGKTRGRNSAPMSLRPGFSHTLPYSVRELEAMVRSVRDFRCVLEDMEQQLLLEQDSVFKALSDPERHQCERCVLCAHREEVRYIQALREAVKMEAEELEMQLSDLAHHHDQGFKTKMRRLLDEQSRLRVLLKIPSPWKPQRVSVRSVSTQCALPSTSPERTGRNEDGDGFDSENLRRNAADGILGVTREEIVGSNMEEQDRASAKPVDDDDQEENAQRKPRRKDTPVLSTPPQIP
ncbi:hypothetical protein JZ751_019323, partial [Albula glossodonta]